MKQKKLKPLKKETIANLADLFELKAGFATTPWNTMTKCMYPGCTDAVTCDGLGFCTVPATCQVAVCD